MSETDQYSWANGLAESGFLVGALIGMIPTVLGTLVVFFTVGGHFDSLLGWIFALICGVLAWQILGAVFGGILGAICMIIGVVVGAIMDAFGIGQ